MPLVGALVVIVLLLFVMWWAVAHEQAPSPANVAVAYERAWDMLDFSLLFDLSGYELRDGMRREQFIAAKKAAYGQHPHDHLQAKIEVETAVTGQDTALVITRVSTDDGSVRNNVLLEDRGGSWTVVGYNLRPEREASSN